MIFIRVDITNSQPFHNWQIKISEVGMNEKKFITYFPATYTRSSFL